MVLKDDDYSLQAVQDLPNEEDPLWDPIEVPWHEEGAQKAT